MIYNSLICVVVLSSCATGDEDNTSLKELNQFDDMRACAMYGIRYLDKEYLFDPQHIVTIGDTIAVEVAFHAVAPSCYVEFVEIDRSCSYQPDYLWHEGLDNICGKTISEINVILKQINRHPRYPYFVRAVKDVHQGMNE